MNLHEKTASNVKGWIRLAAIIAAALLSYSADSARAADVNRGHGWELMLSGGYQPVDNSAADLEQGLRDGQLDGNPCGNPGEIFCSSVPMPSSDFDRLSYTIGLSRSLTRRFGLQALFSSSDLGSSYGYFDGGYGAIYDADLDIRHKRLSVLGLAAKFRPLPEIYLGLGPALYWLDFNIVTGDAQFFDFQRARRFGIIAIGGLTLPKSSRFFVNAGLQYRHAGKFTLGPFDAKNINGDVLTAMPETKVSMNHLVLLLGVGLRM